jgi:hypothetical protein
VDILEIIKKTIRRTNTNQEDSAINQ